MDFNSEADYVDYYCPQWKGKVEVVLDDRTRVDCLTDSHAIEFDWCKKWAEAIGQSLYYAKMTNRKPKIVLICSSGETRFIKRLEIATDIEYEVITKQGK
jgi:hypothetical protein